MMELEALPEVQLVLLDLEVNGVHLLLYGRDGLLHGIHAPWIADRASII
jgi:hypothetical protein